MTLEEANKLAVTGHYTQPPPATLPISPSIVAPKDPDNMPHTEVPKPLTPDDYNQLSVKDAQVFHQFKGMDMLHKQDQLASMANKGNFMKGVLKEKGLKKFAKEHYDLD